jgi:tetratricopeptide (TPR) repeat protein
LYHLEGQVSSNISSSLTQFQKERHEYAAALNEKQKTSDTDAMTIASTLSSMGLIQYHLRQYEEAFHSYHEALRLLRKYFGTDDTPDIASTLNSIGLTLFKQNKIILAGACFIESLRIRTHLFGSDNKDVAILWYNIATICFEGGNDDLAIKMYKETLRVERASIGSYHHDVVLTLLHIGQALQRVGQLEDALSYFQEALEIERMLKGDDVSIAKILNHIGNIQLQEGEVASMMKCFSEAERLLEKRGNSGEGLVIVGYNFYGISKTHPKSAPVA